MAKGAKILPLKSNQEIAEIIVRKMGEYVNGLDRRDLGIPMLDEVCVMQMEHMVEQILNNQNKGVKVPEY